MRLHGRRLQGEWTLVPARLDGKEENWLLIKRRDGEAPERSGRHEYSPMLATQADRLPSRPRMVVRGEVRRLSAPSRTSKAARRRLVSRNGNDLTERFRGVAKEVARAVKTPDAVLDGEVCRLDPSGRASFSELQRGAGHLVYYVFDLLEADGIRSSTFRCTSGGPGCARCSTHATRRCAVSEDFADGDALLAAADDQGLEGVIAKRAESSTSRDGAHATG